MKIKVALLNQNFYWLQGFLTCMDLLYIFVIYPLLLSRWQWYLDGLPDQGTRENTTDINSPKYFTHTMYLSKSTR